MGDFVSVLVAGNKYSVACVESIWQEKTGELRFEARWFEQDTKNNLLENEVLETDSMDDCDIDCINGFVKIVQQEDYCSEGEEENYFCRHFYASDLRVTRQSTLWSGNPGVLSKRLEHLSTEKNISDLDGFESASKRLQSSAVPSTLPCREDERQMVMDFLSTHLGDGGGGALYISGMPGTGKTATVREVVRTLQANQTYEFDFVELNGMKLPHPYHAYTLLHKALTKEYAGQEKAAQLLERRFSSGASRRICVLMVDELDYMVTRRQTVLFNLFDWPTRKNAKLIVVGIANTMDLPERFFPKIQSRLGMTRVVFQPYTRQQIERIVSSRLEGLSVFDNDAIQMCSRKVASLSGDIRRALQICRRAAELCQQEAEPVVTLEHVNKVAASLSGNLYILALQKASKFEKVLMITLYKHFEAQGKEECSVADILHHFDFHCKRVHETDPLTKKEIILLCSRLGSSRLLKVKQNEDEYYPSLRLGLEQDDIKFALQNDVDCSGLIA